MNYIYCTCCTYVIDVCPDLVRALVALDVALSCLAHRVRFDNHFGVSHSKRSYAPRSLAYARLRDTSDDLYSICVCPIQLTRSVSTIFAEGLATCVLQIDFA